MRLTDFTHYHFSSLINIKTMNKQNGFTLIELMIVVAIVGVIAGIAYPSYQDSLVKSRRADAKAALLELSVFMERLYTTTGCYNPGATDKVCGDGNDAAPTLPFSTTPKSGTANYNLSLSVITASTFTLQSVPVATITDSKCGSLTLTHTGVKGASYATTPAEVAACW